MPKDKDQGGSAKKVPIKGKGTSKAYQEGQDLKDLPLSWMRPFVLQLRKNVTLETAAAYVGRHRKTVNKWQRKLPRFREVVQEAREMIIDNLEQSALDRAVNGWLEPVYYKGDIVGHIRKFSDALTIFMLKCWRSDRYAIDRQADGVGSIEERAHEVQKAVAFILQSGGPPNGANGNGNGSTATKSKVDPTSLPSRTK